MASQKKTDPTSHHNPPADPPPISDPTHLETGFKGVWNTAPSVQARLFAVEGEVPLTVRVERLPARGEGDVAHGDGKGPG